jgi:hypothetical protein
MPSEVITGQNQSWILRRMALPALRAGQRQLPATLLLALATFSSAFLSSPAVCGQSQKAVSPVDVSETRDKPLRPVSSSTENDVEKLTAVVADQQKRIEQLERLVDEQRKLIEQALHPASTTNRAVAENSGPVKLDPASSPNIRPEAVPATAEPVRRVQDPNADTSSPLTLRIGKVSVTPYGFLELTTIVRDQNVGSGLSTNFGSVPFANTTAGHLSEFRFTAQNSRLGVRLDAHHGGTDILGLIETDFAGFSPGNVPVTTNSNGIRMRLFWVSARKHKWEILAGQSWSLLTPNRKGV